MASFWNLQTNPTVNASALYASTRPSFTANATLTYFSNSVETYPSVATGSTVTGTASGYYSRVMRNNIAGDGNGTHLAMTGLQIDYGHGNNAVVAPQTTNAYGIYITPHIRTGTVTNMYDMYILADTTGGTATNRFGIYQEGNNKNYFAGSIGVGTAPTANAKLEVGGRILASGAIGSVEVAYAVAAGATYPPAGGIDMSLSNVFKISPGAAGACPTIKVDFTKMNSGHPYTLALTGYNSGTCSIQDQTASAANVKFYGGAAPALTAAQDVICSITKIGTTLYASCLLF